MGGKPVRSCVENDVKHIDLGRGSASENSSNFPYDKLFNFQEVKQLHVMSS
jgi:hypothetical protein